MLTSATNPVCLGCHPSNVAALTALTTTLASMKASAPSAGTYSASPAPDTQPERQEAGNERPTAYTPWHRHTATAPTPRCEQSHTGVALGCPQQLLELWPMRLADVEDLARSGATVLRSTHVRLGQVVHVHPRPPLVLQACAYNVDKSELHTPSTRLR